MSKPKILFVDEDILLREIGMKDVASIFNAIDTHREYMAEWLPFVELITDISLTHTFVENYLNAEVKDFTCVIYFRQQFAGLIGLKDTDFDNMKTEIGYWLSEDFQHRGIITRSGKTLIDYAFDELKMNRIQLKAATENFKSQRVAERLGFIKEGIERKG